MNPGDIAVVQASFAKVAPIADTAAKLFYARLFELDPSVRPLFRTNLDEQGRRLMEMIAAAVNGLGDLPALVPVLQDLGRRHARYGVESTHYQVVGQALLDTLEKGLGRDFTPQARNAWSAVYKTMADTMIAAAAAPKGGAA